MRIVYVTSSFPFGGGEAFLLPEIQYLRDTGNQLWIIPVFPKGDPVHAGARDFVPHTLRWPRNKASLLLQGWVWLVQHATQSWPAFRSAWRSKTLRTRIRNIYCLLMAAAVASEYGNWQADHIHAHWLHYPASFAMMLSQLTGVPWSVTAHRNDILANNLIPEKLASASFTRFISKDGLETAKRLAPEADFSRALVVHMGVLTDNRDGKRGSLVNVPGVNQLDDVPILLCPARLHEIKGHRYLIEAAKIMAENGVRFELWLVGSGPLETELKSLVAASGLCNVVRFLGQVGNELLLTWYSTGRIRGVVLPSLHEGIPVSLMEAMSHGIPVVATRVGGTPELVRDGAGFLVSPRDPVELAESLTRLVSDDVAHQQMSTAAVQVVQEAFSISAIGPRLQELFETHAVRDQTVGSGLWETDLDTAPTREEV
jgi:colanic acid/amylovoran biosynthesis glycosyltransferase